MGEQKPKVREKRMGKGIQGTRYARMWRRASGALLPAESTCRESTSTDQGKRSLDFFFLGS